MKKVIQSIDSSSQIPPLAKQNQRRGVDLSLYGVLDTTSSTDQWLSKLPKKLAEAWDDSPEGTVLGMLTFTKGSPPVANLKPKQPPIAPRVVARNGMKRSETSAQKPPPIIPQKISIRVSDEFANRDRSLPLDYTLTNLTTKIPTMHSFSRHVHDGSIKIHGTIVRTCNLQMERRTQRYKEMCKARLADSVVTGGKNKRFVKPVENAELAVRSSAVAASSSSVMGSAGFTGGSSFGNSIAEHGQKALEVQKDFQNSLVALGGNSLSRKRKFKDDDPIQTILFVLFDHKHYWSLKELRSGSGGRSEKEIKGELSKIAEFQKSGEFKGTWKLKAEFRGLDEDKRITTDGGTNGD